MRIRVMLSSRIRTQVEVGGEEGGVEISVARRRLKETLEQQTLFDLPLFEVWTSESPGDQALGRIEGAWRKSLSQVREADVVLVLYTGEAGWTPPNQTLGICHAEFLEAWNGERPKLKVVRVLNPRLARRDQAEMDRDQRFQADCNRYNPVSPEAATVEDIVTLGCRQAWEVVAQLVGLGRREARRGEYSAGAPLDWSRFDFAHRKKEMEKALGDTWPAGRPMRR